MPENQRILPRALSAQAWQSFHIQKITGTSKMNMFLESLQKPFFYIKEQISTRKFKIKFCFVLYFIFQNWRKWVLT